jgi:anti-sigma regulatory factor (Ser/Thr protein kinase)
VIGTQYSDRVLYELIQNAHDAHNVADQGKIAIKLTLHSHERGTLYIANGGSGFTFENVEAVRNLAISSKEVGEGIGNKGLGFRSIEALTDDVRTRAAASRIKLTEQRIVGLRNESAGPKYVYDTVVPGLAVRTSRNGIKTFVVVRKIHGRTQRITLGRFPALRLDDARQAAQGVAGDLAQGRDPIAQRKALRIRRTRLEEIWPKYLLHLKSRNRTWARDEERWKTHVAPALGKKAAQDITRADCQALVDRIGLRHKIAANRIASFLSALFSFAADDVPINPAKKLRRYPENSRSRILKSEELPML